MKTAKNFPNGFHSWIETYYEVVQRITSEISGDVLSYRVNQVFTEFGHGGCYQLAEELTDRFETLNKGRAWDGEFFDEIDEFLDKEMSQPIK